VYREREARGYADGHAFVSIFKNAGVAAGASLRHPHAQVVALRAVPLSIAARMERLTAVCGICALMVGESTRIVARTAEFVAYVPDGSRSGFEVRIAPARHGGRFSQAGEALAASLAQTLADVMKRLAATLGEALPFNLALQSAPRDPRAEALLHWEIEIVPRLENFGGYELGTGGFLVSRLPEEAARILRSADGAAHA
jgi:UDPglucose--hexose-1-phosphate uridylyltransferase